MTPWTEAHLASPSITLSWNLLEFMSIELGMSSNHPILCYPLLFLPSVFPSIRVFSNKLALCIRWPKCWSISFSIVLPMNIIQCWSPLGLTGVISLQSKGLWRVFSQNRSLKASILLCSVFFMVQLSNPYVTTGKTIALTRQTFVTKVMSLLFDMLSRFVMGFLPRRKSFLFHGCIL